ncbi:MAG: Gfo/Idh/MocA family oxidoreductase [Armatimonadota bacterium]|nr:Gfo/Idh/MocA family oxidoreductase [Armatimonadota bacterium]
MRAVRFAVIGCGFWAPYQISGWLEVGGVELTAVCDRNRSKAEQIARRFHVPRYYEDAETMLDTEEIDFVDIITSVESHAPLTLLAAQRGKAVICQKPMAPDLETAKRMVSECKSRGVPFFVHENWRWQVPIREVKRAMIESGVGQPFRGHILYANSYPVFENQPFLRELEQFILTDMGTHILDVARFLFGEAQRVYCQTKRVNTEIKGEDVASVMMLMENEATVTCELSYASKLEHDRFPETFIRVECENGSVELGPDYWVKVTVDGKTTAQRHVPPSYDWATPTHQVVHASIVDCNANLLNAIREGTPAETTGEDNLRTLELVFAAYESARTGKAVNVPN